tara:strand:+ start:3721 stop:4077 length:357 start_codon:yes stop_codon:yes gene_type:complete
MSKHIIFVVMLFIVGNLLAWFQANSQFIWKWWYDRPMLTILVYSVPTSFAFYYGWRYAVEYFGGSLWSARMFAFGLATIVFAGLSYAVKGEGINLKTAVCITLSFVIILIQMFWKADQ